MPQFIVVHVARHLYTWNRRRFDLKASVNRRDHAAAMAPAAGEFHLAGTMNAPRTPSGTLACQEYRHAPNEGRRYEIIDGEFYMNPASRPDHQTFSPH
jgi:hypothetical protein